jgi:hypothetical protein
MLYWSYFSYRTKNDSLSPSPCGTLGQNEIREQICVFMCLYQETICGLLHVMDPDPLPNMMHLFSNLRLENKETVIVQVCNRLH